MISLTMRWTFLLALCACSPVPGFVDEDGDGSPQGEDCDDARADVQPGGVEVCDEGATDEDCDGRIDADDPDVADRRILHPDGDGDGYGDASTASTCPGPGWTEDGSDCDDGDPAVHPGAAEICDLALVDEDCDGQVNGADPDATAPLTWYTDADDDGWGGDEASVSCDAPPDGRPVTGDCDDADPERFPGAVERCNLLDDDCDGAADEEVTQAVWEDADQDGYGDPLAPVQGCDLPGFATNGDDCADDDAGINPGAAEICADGVDQDCDGGPGTCDLSGERDSTNADAIFVGGLREDRAGSAIAGVGDIDADGRADWMLGAPTTSVDAVASGAAYLIAGGTTGTLSVATAVARVRGGSPASAIGSAVLGLGDIDGDGFDDIAVGASGATWLDRPGGGVSLFLGPVRGDVPFEAADGAWYSVETGAFLGAQLDRGRGVAGDGNPNLLAGAPAANAEGTDRGAVYLFSATTGAAMTTDEALAVVEGDRDDAALGRSFAGLGDIDGDGVGNLALGDPGASSELGAVYLISGPLVGTMSVADADVTLLGDDPGGRAGETVIGPGDLDDDGRADLIVGAPEADVVDFECGAVYVFLDPTSGAASAADADAVVTGAADWEHAGSALTAMPDMDGDGVPDFAVTAEDWPDGRGTGRVYLLSGARAGTASVDDNLFGASGDPGSTGFGAVLASAGDTDGDGTIDFLAGSPESDLGAVDAGAVWLFLNRGL